MLHFRIIRRLQKSCFADAKLFYVEIKANRVSDSVGKFGIWAIWLDMCCVRLLGRSFAKATRGSLFFGFSGKLFDQSEPVVDRRSRSLRCR